MRFGWLLAACLLTAHSVTGKPAKQQNTAAKKTNDENAVKKQTDWREARADGAKSCKGKFGPWFTNTKGKPIPRLVKDITRILSESVYDENEGKIEKEAKLRKEADHKKAANKKLTKAERKMRQLETMLADTLYLSSDDTANSEKGRDPEKLAAYAKQANQYSSQVAQKARLGPEDEFTLSEWCDTIWRTGNDSPLDPDPVQAEPQVDLEAIKLEL